MLHWIAMSPGGSRPPFFAIMAVALAIVVGVLCAGVWQAGSASAAPASGAALSITVDHVLSLTTESVAVTVTGELPASLVGDKLVVRIEGPAQLSEITANSPNLPEAGKLVRTLGQTPATTGTAPSTTTTLGAGNGSLDDLQAGKLNETVTLPSGTPAAAGAYLVVAEIKSGSDVVAGAQTWIGKAAPRETPLDLAFVWPVSLGVHRDPAGVFYDNVLEQAVSSGAGSEGSLSALLAVGQRFPNWNLTLALEPLLLTQLRDMADGYTLLDPSGKQVVVRSDDPRAQSADAFLAALKDLTSRTSVEVAVSPYSGADLGVLAAEGWRDGFEQIQMGKQELQQTLDLGKALVGAFSPDLGLTSAGLASYADASIDHVVVSDSLARLLTETVDAGAVAVRARDVKNDRVTLVLASGDLSSVMVPPWDAGVFFAALAAELASTPRDALVVTPGTQFIIPPQLYLETIGETLAGLRWVNTQTLTELLRAHSPSTRPIMLNANPGASSGYVEGALLESVRAAHVAVTDLASVADPTRAQVETARRLLYVAESRWWWRPQTTPGEATVGLHFAEQARLLAQTELDKLRFVGASSGTMTGRKGVVTLTLENKADYAVTAALRLGGTGVTLPDGQTIKVELPPGQTQVSVKVVSADGSHKLDAQLVAGTSVLDEVSQPLRFITFSTILPAIVAAGIGLLAGLLFVVRWLVRRRHPAARPGGSPAPPPAEG